MKAISDRKLRITLFFSVLFSCLLLVNWHYDFEFTSGTPFNIRAFVYNIFFERELNIDHFWSNAGIDVAYSPNGHLYSGYPPGAAFITLPFFAVEQVVAYLHTHLLGPMNGTIAWWLESVFIGLPSMLALALTSVLLFDILRRFDVSQKVSLLTAWALPFTTFILPYANVAHYHTLAMFWFFLSLWSLLGLQGQALQTQKGRVFLAGFALGMAGLTEYATVLYAVPVGGYLLKKFQSEALTKKSLALFLRTFALGLAIPLTVLALYNWHSFGAPWKFSHQFHGHFPLDLNFYLSQSLDARIELAKQLVPKTLVFGLVPWVSLFGIYFSPLRGLFFHAPLVVLAPFGIVWLWKKYRTEAAALLGCLAITTLLYSFWTEWWGGAAYGPRFLISALPIWFLFVGFGLKHLRAVSRKPRPIVVLCSCVFMFSCFFVANAAALTGVRDFVREHDIAAPWRLVPVERVQKFVGAVSTLDDSKLSPFIFRFHSELPVISSLSPFVLYSSFFILLLIVELLPLICLFRKDNK